MKLTAAEYHRVLAERFEDVELQMVDIPSERREEAFIALVDGVYAQRGWKMLDPTWCKDRDEALQGVGRAIKKLRSVLRRSPGPGVSSVESLADNLEREYQRLVDNRYSKPFLTLTRAGLGWVKGGRGGRPRATWRKETEAKLRALGIPALTVEALLDAAGLTGPTPKRKRKLA